MFELALDLALQSECERCNVSVDEHCGRGGLHMARVADTLGLSEDRTWAAYGYVVDEAKL